MSDIRQLHGPVSISVGQWQVMVDSDVPPLMYKHYVSNAELVDEISLDRDGRYFMTTVSPAAADWPELVVALRYKPNVGGFDPGVAVVDSTVFIGAGDTTVCYQKDPAWTRLWVDAVELGFWGWAIHSDIVVMQGELTLAAFDSGGTKLWSRFVEPPWTYEVDEHRQVTLDVMGTISRFDLWTGS